MDQKWIFLQRHKDEGGVGLLNFINYYWATNVHKIQFWMSPTESQPLWALMEQNASSPVSLAALVCAPVPLSKKNLINNPVVSATLKILSKFRLHFKHKANLLTFPTIYDQPSLPDMELEGPDLYQGSVCLWHISNFPTGSSALFHPANTFL